MISPALFLTLAALAGLAACRASPGPDAVGPSSQLTVEWKGAVNRTFTAPAEGRWCARDRLLEIVASQADTGVGLALAMLDSLRPGQHPVVSSAVPVDWRPMALAAVRWVNDTAVRGFEGNSGGVVVTTVGPDGVSGTIDLRLKHHNTPDTIRMTGRFSSVPVGPSDTLCGRTSQPTPR
ncbi:MAG: hypothetical protein ACKVZ0_03725 [Gemmatimonadales bacterium]